MNVVRREGGSESWGSDEDEHATLNAKDVRTVLMVDGRRVCLCPLCRVVRGQLRETREALSAPPDLSWAGAVRESEGSSDECA